MSEELQLYEQEEGKIRPANLNQAIRLSEILAKSALVPAGFKGHPENVLVAMQMGAELGLAPMQAIQGITVINGRPSVWGDAMLALVSNHPQFDDIEETVEDGVATCTVKRTGRSPTVRKFSVDDAKRAKLWGKPGPWTTYPDRMLQMRARSFALRDSFADALKGIIATEEAQDIPRKQISA